MKNSRFATSIHIMTLLTQFRGEYISSSHIAHSININPATVRKELGHLKKHGFIKTWEGKNGGVMLSQYPDKIFLSDIFYSLLNEGETLFGFSSQEPNKTCPVGKRINKSLDSLYSGIHESVYRYLENYSLEAFSRSVID